MQAGIRSQSLIVNLPGSPKAALENLEAVLPTLEHGLKMLSGAPADCAKADQKSAWTVRRDAAALAKLFGCQTTDFGVDLPVRRKRDIKQHREDKWVGRFAPGRRSELVVLGRGAELRRCEIQRLTLEDICVEDGAAVVVVRKGKGGKRRLVSILHPNWGHHVPGGCRVLKAAQKRRRDPRGQRRRFEGSGSLG